MMPAPWRLDYEGRAPFPGAALEFGTWSSRILMTDHMPTIDSADASYDDTPSVRGDGTRFGEDFLGSSNVTFNLEISTSNEAEATDLIDEFKAAWRADAIRRTPGALAMLTAHTGRVTFGRPRKSPTDGDRTYQGRATIVAEFLTADDLWYGPEQVEEVTLVPFSRGGVTGPVVAPVIVNSGRTDQSRPFVVEGRLPAWAQLRVNGPIVNPTVEVVGAFRFGFATTLAFDEWIDIDLRTGRQSILRNGTSTISVDAASTPLVDAYLPPNRYELVLRGTSPAGNPTARLSWRDAHTHW